MRFVSRSRVLEPARAGSFCGEPGLRLRQVCWGLPVRVST